MLTTVLTQLLNTSVAASNTSQGMKCGCRASLTPAEGGASLVNSYLGRIEFFFPSYSNVMTAKCTWLQFRTGK